jgi:hypothetical protein
MSVSGTTPTKRSRAYPPEPAVSVAVPELEQAASDAVFGLGVAALPDMVAEFCGLLLVTLVGGGLEDEGSEGGLLGVHGQRRLRLALLQPLLAAALSCDRSGH